MDKGSVSVIVLVKIRSLSFWSRKLVREVPVNCSRSADRSAQLLVFPSFFTSSVVISHFKKND